jgi:hypothetical protein
MSREDWLVGVLVSVLIAFSLLGMERRDSWAQDGFYVIPIAAMTFRGDWDAGTTYKAKDVVFHNGSSWFSLVGSNLGHAPDLSPTQWTMLAQKGDQGPVNPNADTVDGKHASDLALSTHTHFSSQITDIIPDSKIADSITRDTELAAGLSGKANLAHTHSGSDISTGTVAEARIDSLITRDSELSAGLATKANSVHTHDDRYYTKAEVDALKTQITTLQEVVGQLQALLQGVTRTGNDVMFNGVNVHVRNGSGSTDSTNGLGNLIVGYNERRNDGTDNRNGSHMLVLGAYQNFASYGGLVGGVWNGVSAPWASVLAGHQNNATGNGSSVSGGMSNTAGGYYSSVTGGQGNNATEYYASVTGGQGNTASGLHASVTGGLYNSAVGQWSFVGGGGHRIYGYGNMAYANLSAILGGASNFTGVAGDQVQGELSTVSGGDTNVARGLASSVSGGKNNIAIDAGSSVVGGYYVNGYGQNSTASGSLVADGISNKGPTSGDLPNGGAAFPRLVYDSGFINTGETSMRLPVNNTIPSTSYDKNRFKMEIDQRHFTGYIANCSYSFSGGDCAYWFPPDGSNDVWINNGRADIFDTRLRIWYME